MIELFDDRDRASGLAEQGDVLSGVDERLEMVPHRDPLTKLEAPPLAAPAVAAVRVHDPGVYFGRQVDQTTSLRQRRDQRCQRHRPRLRLALHAGEDDALD